MNPSSYKQRFYEEIVTDITTRTQSAKTHNRTTQPKNQKDEQQGPLNAD